MATEIKIDMTREFEQIWDEHHNPEHKEREKYKNNRKTYGYKEIT